MYKSLEMALWSVKFGEQFIHLGHDDTPVLQQGTDEQDLSQDVTLEAQSSSSTDSLPLLQQYWWVASLPLCLLMLIQVSGT